MKSEFRQPVKLAQPGELRASIVYEHQLDLLEQGTPASLLLNFDLFFLGVSLTSLGTIVGASPGQERVYNTFLTLFLVTIIAGTVLLAVWFFMHRSARGLVQEIRAQMPPNPAVEGEPRSLTGRE